MTCEEMKARFQIGDIVERSPEFMKLNPKFKNFKVEVLQLMNDRFLLVRGEQEAGRLRIPETMHVIEREGIRIGDFVRPKHNQSTHCIYRLDSFDKDGWVYATGVEGDNTPLWLPSFRRMTDQEVAEHVPFGFGKSPAVKTLNELIRDQLSDSLAALDARTKTKDGAPEPFEPFASSIGSVYQDLISNLKLYNEMAKEAGAPQFDLLQR